jgi:hypothetical protein
MQGLKGHSDNDSFYSDELIACILSSYVWSKRDSIEVKRGVDSEKKSRSVRRTDVSTRHTSIMTHMCQLMLFIPSTKMMSHAIRSAYCMCRQTHRHMTSYTKEKVPRSAAAAAAAAAARHERCHERSHRSSGGEDRCDRLTSRELLNSPVAAAKRAGLLENRTVTSSFVRGIGLRGVYPASPCRTSLQCTQSPSMLELCVNDVAESVIYYR